MDDVAVHAQHIHEQAEGGGVAHAHRRAAGQHVVGCEGGVAHARAADDASGAVADIFHHPFVDGFLFFIAVHTILNDLLQHLLRHAQGVPVLLAEAAVVAAYVGVGDVGSGADLVLAAHLIAVLHILVFLFGRFGLALQLMVDVLAHLLVLDGGLVDAEPQAGDEAAGKQKGGGSFDCLSSLAGVFECGAGCVGFCVHGAGFLHSVKG